MDLWAGIRSGDTFSLVAMGILGFAGVVAYFVIQRIVRAAVARRVRRAGTGAPETSFQDLSKLKAKGVLTEEEAKAVRAALARQFLDEQKQRAAPPPAKDAKGFSALDALASEAPLLEEQLRARRGAPPPSDAPPDAADPAKPEPAPDSDGLPERLERLAGADDVVLDELEGAGFLSAEDTALIRARRKAKP